MDKKLLLLPDALQDVAAAFHWYESRQPGLGEEFLRCVDARLLAISRNPELHAVVHEEYRRALVRRFPYAIFYECVEDTVTVFSVFHCSGDPDKWRRRLSTDR